MMVLYAGIQYGYVDDRSKLNKNALPDKIGRAFLFNLLLLNSF